MQTYWWSLCAGSSGSWFGWRQAAHVVNRVWDGAKAKDRAYQLEKHLQARSMQTRTTVNYNNGEQSMVFEDVVTCLWAMTKQLEFHRHIPCTHWVDCVVQYTVMSMHHHYMYQFYFGFSTVMSWKNSWEPPKKTIVHIETRRLALSVWLNRSSKHLGQHCKVAGSNLTCRDDSKTRWRLHSVGPTSTRPSSLGHWKYHSLTSS